MSDSNILKNNKIDIDKILFDHIDLYYKSEKLKTICGASKYAISNGKRVRSIIIKSILGSNVCLDNAICFIEFIHASSLIMDDIMDDDIIRKNEPTLHIKYDETIAQLTAMQLLSTAFVELSEIVRKYDGKNKEQVTTYITCNIMTRFQNLCIGQYLDLSDFDEKNLDEMIIYKTSTLFEMSFVISWILLTESLNKIDEVKELAICFGLLYQIADDIEDYDDDIKKDKKSNYAIINGKEKSIIKFNELRESFIDKSNKLGIYTNEINKIIDFLNKF